MNHRRLARVGALAAVIGALAQVTATVFEPERADDPLKAISAVAGSGIWTLDRVIDLIGLFLTVGALAVVGRTFTGGPGRDWARVGQPFLAVLGALGASAILTGATLKKLADAWATAGPAAKPAQLAVFAAASQTTDAFFFCAFVAMGLYLGTLSAAILSAGGYARWIGWLCAASASLVLAGDFLTLASNAAFFAVLLGFLLFMAALIALGVTMWRQAARSTSATDRMVTLTGGDLP